MNERVFSFSSESNIFKVLWSLALGVERHFINYVIPTVQTTFVLAYAESKKKFTKPFYFVGLHKIPKVQTTFVLWSKVAKSTLLWIFSKSDNFQIKAGLDTMFDFFQLWETLQSELIARFLAVFSVFHKKKFFLGWYNFKFLILKFPKSTKMDFLACTTSKMAANVINDYV